MLQREIAEVQLVEDSEKEIVRKILAGGKEEFRHLVLRYQDQVYTLIMRQVKDAECAEELLQDCFVRAFRALASFRFEATLSTWLSGIALNLTNSYLSSKKYKTKRQEESLVSTDIPETDQAAESSVKERRIEEVRQAVMELPVKLREAVVLCGFEGKSYEEASRILKIPIGTVRSRLNQARNVLREKVSRED